MSLLKILLLILMALDIFAISYVRLKKPNMSSRITKLITQFYMVICHYYMGFSSVLAYLYKGELICLQSYLVSSSGF